MEPVLAGSIVGALSRLAPEVVKIIDARSERKHELQMVKLQAEVEREKQAGQLELAKQQGETQLAVAKTQQAGQYDIAALGALTESIKSQATVTGVKFIDAISASVRPVVTYLLVMLYIFTKGQPDVPYWTAEDQALFGAVLNFWFLGRVLDKWNPTRL